MLNGIVKLRNAARTGMNEKGKKMRFLDGRREFLSFQLKLLSLEQGNYNVLEDERFATSMVMYINELHRFRYMGFIHRLLTVLGDCSICDDVRYREKSLFILSIFIETVVGKDDEQFFQAMSWIFLRWLDREDELLECHQHVCNQIKKLLLDSVNKGAYRQITPWLSLLGKIAKGDIVRNDALQAVVAGLHKSVLDELLERPLVPGRSWSRVKSYEVECLYQYFREEGAEFLVRELYESDSKDRRLAIIAILSRLPDNLVYTLVENLDASPPWYVLRNAIKIIASIGQVGHYALVRPFLEHTDSRVQREVLSFISRMGRKRGLEELLHILEVCNDDIKLQVIPVLGRSGEKAAEHGLIKLLEQRTRVISPEFDGVALMLCRELRNYPTIRVGQVLRRLLDDREKTHLADDTLALAARDSFEMVSTM